MGGSYSVPTNNTKEVLNTIFKEMFTRIDFRDLYSLADPEKCKDYIIVGASALDKIFVKMKLQPLKKSDGTVYFQKIASIQKSLPSDIQQSQKENCREIAFFFVRIFQIFGALFLSMYDTELPSLDLQDKELTRERKDDQGFLTTERLTGRSSSPNAKKSWWSGIGGANYENICREILRKYIKRSDPRSGKYLLTPDIYMNFNDLPPEDSIDPDNFVLVLQNSFRAPSGNTHVISARLIFRFGGQRGGVDENDQSLVPNFRSVAPVAPTFIAPVAPTFTAPVAPTFTAPVAPVVPTSTAPTAPLKDPPVTQTSFTTERRKISNPPPVLAAPQLLQQTASPPFLTSEKPEELVKFTIILRDFEITSAGNQNIKLPKIDIVRTIVKSGSEYVLEESRSTNFPNVVKGMFKEAVEQITQTNRTIAGYFQKWKYLTSSLSTSQYIVGTKIIFLGGQERTEAPLLKWSASIKLEKETKSFDVVGKISIEVIKPTDGKKQLEFKVSIDFSELPEKIKDKEILNQLSVPRELVVSTFYTSILDDPPKSQGGKSIAQFIEYTFKKIVPGSIEETHGKLYDAKTGQYLPYNSSSIDPTLKIKRLWESLSKNPPIKAHCIARASQLLSANALRGNFTKEGFSSICRLKFAFQENGSLPKPGEQIRTSAGIAALSSLLFDTLSTTGEFKLTAKMDPPEKKKWDDFKKEMQILFELDISTEGAKPLEDIKQQTFQICDDKFKDKRIILPIELQRELYGVTQNLVAQQKSHVQSAFALIFQLFDQNEIIRNKRIILNENLFMRGIDGINEISNSATTLLTEYYKDCETTYQQGVKMIYASNDTRMLSSA